MGCNCGRKAPVKVERPQVQQYAERSGQVPFSGTAPKSVQAGPTSFQRFDRTDNNTYPYRIKH